MSAMWSGRERHRTAPSRRPGRRVLAVAVVLTAVMFSWQGYHLYSADRAASRVQTATLVGAVHSAGERQISLVHELEHDVLLLGYDLDHPDVADWPERYAVASAETQAATLSALAGTGDRLAGPVGRVGTTGRELDRQVENALAVLSTGGSEQAPVALLDQQYLAAQAEFGGAVDGQIADLAADLQAETAAERLDEFHSVAFALVLFTTAIGAWAAFGRNLRRSRARLAEEHQRRLEAEAESSQMQKMEALGMMADGIAHDVKNLTVVILGSIDEVRTGVAADHPASTALTRIEEATRQADDLAKALLAFSRKAETPKGAVNLASLIAALTQLLRYMAPPPIQLTVDTPEEAWVQGDAVQLQQAVFNLVANARDAMPDGGNLTITVRSEVSDDGEEPTWLLVVSDTGVGMAPDVVDRLFQPFFTTRPAGRGSGLGLTIVHRIVSDHGGWIDVASRPGQGSTFTVGLPARPAPGPAVADPDRGKSVVLVANPVPQVRSLISNMLASEEYQTLPASTVDEINASFADDRPPIDLAVIDARLMGPDGLHVPPDVPVVVTGAAVHAGHLGGRTNVCVMDEPLSLAALDRTVASLLRPADFLVSS